jgi:hypothetical protein
MAERARRAANARMPVKDSVASPGRHKCFLVASCRGAVTPFQDVGQGRGVGMVRSAGTPVGANERPHVRVLAQKSRTILSLERVPATTLMRESSWAMLLRLRREMRVLALACHAIVACKSSARRRANRLLDEDVHVTIWGNYV